MIFGPQRNVLHVARKFMEFFVEETCGYCTPCRVGNVLLYQGLCKILDGKGEMADLEYLQDLGQTVKTASRCGLGQTSANPVLTTLKNFRPVYEGLVRTDTQGMQASFDIQAALQDAQKLAGRQSVHFAS
jgi:[NiFe] hydrogenase diaphorase moiety large subunit